MRTNVQSSSREASSSAHRDSSPTRPGRPSDDRGGVVVPLLPTADGVLLEDEEPPQRIGLLVIANPRTLYRGWVRAIGPDVTELQLGDHVVYRPFVGARVDVNGVSWMLVRESECVCKLG